MLRFKLGDEAFVHARSSFTRSLTFAHQPTLRAYPVRNAVLPVHNSSNRNKKKSRAFKNKKSAAAFKVQPSPEGFGLGPATHKRARAHSHTNTCV